MWELLFTLPILMVAAFAHGALGFGFPLLSTPLLVLGMDIRSAILLTLIPTVTINLFSILTEARWKEALQRFWPIPTFTIIGSFIGTQLLLTTDPSPYRLLLAVVVIGYLLSDRLPRTQKERHVPAWGLALFGLALGLLAGVVNVFAPLIVIFALETRMKPELMVATFNVSFLTSKSGQIAGFVSQGAFHGPEVTFALIALPLVIASLWIGIRLRKRIDVENYKKALRLVLWVVALYLIVQWVMSIF